MASTTKSNSTQRKAVYVITEGKGEKNFWTRVGVAFINQDGSLNVVLEALPTNGKLHIRDFNGERAEAGEE